jgi:His-Xaa-Ser system radical SAM maturase HxsB
MRRIEPMSHDPGLALVTNDLGEYLFLDRTDAADLAAGRLAPSQPRWRDLEARGLLMWDGPVGGLADVVRRTRKSFVMEGPALHIFVVTLRCDHACQYCQVSRAALNAEGFDMREADALHALDRVFESDAPALTIEFQGGEPAVRFDLVRRIVLAAQDHPARNGRQLRFTMTSTLQRLEEDDLLFCRDHSIHLSTSIDGPDLIHDRQRPVPGGGAWQRTVDALERARRVLGHDGIAALPTITRPALDHPEAVIDTYVRLGFSSIFLRSLAPYGFARKTRKALGYDVGAFMQFYERALDHILALNAQGTCIEETQAAILLRHILTPFHSGYVDLRSPAGAGLGVLVYNYNGQVYPSDEARMAAETGDRRFALGSVRDPLDQLLSSPAMRWLARGAVAETHPDCASCAFVPYCGADPVFHAITQGEPDAPRLGSEFCDRQKALFQLLFARLARRDSETMRTFLAWGLGRPRAQIEPGWIEQ